MRKEAFVVIAAALAMAACQQHGGKTASAAAPIYDSAPVKPRNIQVSVDAAGVVQPETTVEVKSKASGEILAVHAETGEVVKQGTLLVEVDPRTPKNQLDETQAALAAAKARLRIATTQRDRARKLIRSGTLTQTDLEQAELEYANAKAQVVSTQVAVENAKIALEDTQVRAPITGTVIEKSVEAGSVISSPMKDVSGGTVLLKMADLSEVQISAMVDETDIGKIQPGMPAKVTVAAYPNQPFRGDVLKIEPEATVVQNVTMFSVLIRLKNPKGLLKPGMNADVEISIAKRDAVPTVPTAALRTDSDIPATAKMLGIGQAELRNALLGKTAAAKGGHDVQSVTVGGRRLTLPPGVDAQKVSALMRKRREGGTLTSAERETLRRVFAANRRGRSGGFGGPPPGGFEAARALRNRSDSKTKVANYQFGGNYWVVAMRGGKTVPVEIKTGLTDLSYTQVVSGLSVGDKVLLLPSASLYEQQTRLQQFISRRVARSSPFGG